MHHEMRSHRESNVAKIEGFPVVKATIRDNDYSFCICICGMEVR